MAEFYQKEHLETAAELDSLLRIALAKRTPVLRLAFGRALRKAFTDVATSFNSCSTVGLRWIVGKESTVAEVLGNTSAFFESLADTISAPAIVDQPELFALIDPERRLRFVRLALDVRSPLPKLGIQKSLEMMGLTSPQIQQFMLTLFEQYGEDSTHPIWMGLSQYCESQLAWGALWRHLSVDEVRRVLLSVAQARPKVLISSEARRICSLLGYRLTTDVIDEIVKSAIGNMRAKDFSEMTNTAAFDAGTPRSMALHERHLATAWSAQSVYALAEVSSQEMNICRHTAAELLDGLEYVRRQLPAFQKRQLDCWPLFRMRRWCLEALFALGYVEAPLEKESDGHKRPVVYYVDQLYVASNKCPQLSVGTRVLLYPDVAITHFYVIPE
jgi:hypothetical protein